MQDKLNLRDLSVIPMKTGNVELGFFCPISSLFKFSLSYEDKVAEARAELHKLDNHRGRNRTGGIDK